jgi:Pyruvate/2-oxoacid:ferredoxin oxidoreductase gamma subunit
MAFQQVEYEFPDPDKGDKDSLEIELEPSSAEPMQRPGKAKKAEPEVEAGANLKAGDYDVEVVDDTPEVDRGRKPSEPPEDVTEEELQDYSEKVRNRIRHFSKGYHDERRAKEAALRERQELERIAQKLVDENNKLKESTSKSQAALLEQAKKNAKLDFEAAKIKYKRAYEAGDADGVLAAQEELTNSKLKLDRINNFKLPSLQEKEVPVETQQEEVSDTPAPQVDAKAQDWQKANPWFGTDDEMTSFALGLHSKLVKSGVDPQSDEYYETINSRMRRVFPENFEDSEEEKPEAETPKRRANVVAPATRSTAPKKVRLTQTQVAIAKRLGVPLELYAKQVAEEMRKANG